MGTPAKKGTGKKLRRVLGFLFLLFLGAGALGFYMYSNENTEVTYFQTISGPITNPLMGWAPWATIPASGQPHSLVYADLTWRDFEPRQGDYDFDSFEKKQQLARWREEGKRVVFRFVVDVPGSESHLDIPDWLFNKTNGSGAYYDNEYGKGFSPDYSNSVFMDYHAKALHALGERYGRDGFFAFIELGSLGHWGEWHTSPELTPLPAENIRDEYVHQYRKAFPGVHLLMRRPFSIAKTLGLGLYNDMTADLPQTNMWLDWIEHGGSFLPDEANTLSPMPDGWKKAPIGGEQNPALSNSQIYGSELQQTLQLLERSHTTFVGPNCPWKESEGSPLQPGLDQVMASIGYRIYIDHAELQRRVFVGGSIRMSLTFSNSGIAPMYYDWPMRLYLFDTAGKVVSTYEPHFDITKVLPGTFQKMTVNVPISALQNGIYSIGVAIIDPLTQQPGVRFANKNTRQDSIQDIGWFEIRRWFALNWPKV